MKRCKVTALWTNKWKMNMKVKLFRFVLSTLSKLIELESLTHLILTSLLPWRVLSFVTQILFLKWKKPPLNASSVIMKCKDLSKEVKSSNLICVILAKLETPSSSSITLATLVTNSMLRFRKLPKVYLRVKHHRQSIFVLMKILLITSVLVTVSKLQVSTRLWV